MNTALSNVTAQEGYQLLIRGIFTSILRIFYVTHAVQPNLLGAIQQGCP